MPARPFQAPRPPAVPSAFPVRSRRGHGARRATVPAGLLALVAATASCTPVIAERVPARLAMAVDLPIRDLPAPSEVMRASTLPADPAAFSMPFAGRSAHDTLRAHDCLAEAIYYEARSESEAGQRAVAQVVLNRVRHPAWPASVCGVVYQGPLRAGGGCQFTFTCDGSLGQPPRGPGWAAARRLAGEALAGRVYAPIGHATHYHTHAVAPRWAPRLAKVGVIGAHNFYRLPGNAGAPRAFAQAYAGREPVPVPTVLAVALRPDVPRPPTAAPATILDAAVAQVASLPQIPVADSQVREEWRHSGQWRADAPVAPAR